METFRVFITQSKYPVIVYHNKRMREFQLIKGQRGTVVGASDS